jgi:hypothetical protein
MKTRIVFFALTLLLVRGSSIAAPIPWPPGWPNTKALLERSDLVCRATAMQVASIGNSAISGRSGVSTASLAIDRCYKGSAPSSRIRVIFEPPKRPDVYAPALLIKRGDYGLFFLKRANSENEEFNFVSVTDGRLDISALAAAKYDSVVSEIEADLEAGLSDPASDKVVANLQALAGLQKLASTGPLKAMVADSNPTIQGTALLALLKLSDYSELAETVSFLGKSLPQTEQTLLQRPIRNEFERIKDPKALPILHSTLSSPVAFVRGTALKAIKSIHDKSSIRYVIKLLDDPDTEIRYDTVITLALAEQKGEWGPTSYVYEKDEQKYIRGWKGWWETEGKSKYQSKSAGVSRNLSK